MKKILVMFMILLCLTGCSARYDLEIEYDTFKEDIVIYGMSSKTLKNFQDNKYYAIINGINNSKAYNQTIKDSKVNLSYVYNLNDFRQATILKSCFTSYSVISEDNYYILSTSKNLKCASMEGKEAIDDLKVVIKNNHKVIETNGKKINDYTYEWNYNKDNFDSQNIYMKYYKDKYVFNYSKLLLILGIVVGLLLVVLVIVHISLKRNEKVNNL